MQRKFVSVFAFSLMLFVIQFTAVSGAEHSPLLPESEMQLHYGLTRSWYNQIQIDGHDSVLNDILLDRGTLFMVTSNSRLIAYDAESGKLLWSRTVGEPGRDTLSPVANSKAVSVINGNDIYIFDRRNGQLLWETILPGSPSAPGQMTEFYLYVPLVDDRMLCYPLEEQKSPSSVLLKFVDQYEAIGYTLNPLTGKVTKIANETEKQHDFLETQRKKMQLDKELQNAINEDEKVISETLDDSDIAAVDADAIENESAVAINPQQKIFGAGVRIPKIRAKNLADAEMEIQAITFQSNNKVSKEKEKKSAIEPYYLKQNRKFPIVCYSFGITPQQPLIVYESGKMEALAWFTERGYLFFAHANRDEQKFQLQYRLSVVPTDSYIRKSKFHAQPEDYATEKSTQIPRIGSASKYVTDTQSYNKLETKNLLKGYDTDVFRALRKNKIDHYPGSIMNDIAFPPAVVQKDMANKESRFMAIVGTSSGLVFAYDPQNAKLYWWQTIGSPVSGRPTVVKDKIYIPGFDKNFTCLNAQNGEVLWQTSGIETFISASPSRIYTKNYDNELVAVDSESGEQTILFSLKPYEQIYYNNANDRLYLITQNGLIQCLHEATLSEPVWHITPPETYLTLDISDTRTESLSEIDSSVSDASPKPTVPSSNNNIFTEESGDELDSTATENSTNTSTPPAFQAPQQSEENDNFGDLDRF
ncbi:MAG: PQQ-binding-like beta-propeller repeat protein [Planctomycetaceae bacterium]|jgi:outer membrane protein assembly factor BamB|nr:PQQ-binding-like beta-propeller repeat protein [Planctomycetaceae bacterium]